MKSDILSRQLSLSKCFKTHLVRYSPCSWLYIDKIMLFIKTQMSEKNITKLQWVCDDYKDLVILIRLGLGILQTTYLLALQNHQF